MDPKYISMIHKQVLHILKYEYILIGYYKSHGVRIRVI